MTHATILRNALIANKRIEPHAYEIKPITLAGTVIIALIGSEVVFLTPQGRDRRGTGKDVRACQSCVRPRCCWERWPRRQPATHPPHTPIQDSSWQRFFLRAAYRTRIQRGG